MNDAQVFALMKAIVEAPGFEYLTDYKQDFYDFDREYLSQGWAPGVSMLWIVRTMGTHLCRLHVHPRVNEEVQAAMSLTDLFKAYHLTDKGVTEVNHHKAKDLLKTFQFEVRGNWLYAGSPRQTWLPIASIYVDLQFDAKACRYGGDVHFQSSTDHVNWTLPELLALRHVAHAEVLTRTSSLWSCTKNVYLDGQELLDQIELKKAKASKSLQHNEAAALAA